MTAHVVAARPLKPAGSCPPAQGDPEPAFVSSIASNICYQFETRADEARGHVVPLELGAGNFARVYRGRQLSEGDRVRAVAIKILHAKARRSHEALFQDEIRMLRKLSDDPSAHVIRMLDVLKIGPMVMCGCGKIYHPLCPGGCGLPLKTLRQGDKLFPSLSCPGCGYELPGHQLDERGGELLGEAARRCCRQTVYARARVGTLLNFVDRDAVVMELIDTELKDFSSQRDRAIAGLGARPKETGRGDRGPAAWLRRLWDADRDGVVLDKTRLLEKVLLMVQLTEAVAWLHGTKRIVHKDLTPDNVMVRFASCDDWRGTDHAGVGLRDRISDMISTPAFSIQLIDFGLSDYDKPSRSWYEDAAAVGHIKEPFLSPEAQGVNHKQSIHSSCALEFEHEVARFKIPPA